MIRFEAFQCLLGVPPPEVIQKRQFLKALEEPLRSSFTLLDFQHALDGSSEPGTQLGLSKWQNQLINVLRVRSTTKLTHSNVKCTQQYAHFSSRPTQPQHVNITYKEWIKQWKLFQIEQAYRWSIMATNDLIARSSTEEWSRERLHQRITTQTIGSKVAIPNRKWKTMPKGICTIQTCQQPQNNTQKGPLETSMTRQRLCYSCLLPRHIEENCLLNASSYL